MISLYEESINSLDTILYDKDMLKEAIYAYKELPGQYFCTTYYYSGKEFKDFITSGRFKLGDIIRCFKISYSYNTELIEQIIKNYKKRKYFRGSDKIRFYFTYDGTNMCLIDVWTEKENYIKPKEFTELFEWRGVRCSKLIFRGILSNEFIKNNPGVIIRKQDGTKIRL